MRHDFSDGAAVATGATVPLSSFPLVEAGGADIGSYTDRRFASRGTAVRATTVFGLTGGHAASRLGGTGLFGTLDYIRRGRLMGH
jgi:hypothetical protein